VEQVLDLNIVRFASVRHVQASFCLASLK